MSFPFAEIKARISLEDLLREDRIKLKRSGKRLVCSSPFQKEKTPSCYIDLDRARFKCFSTGNSGDIFDYVMLTHGCSEEVARNYLALKAGLNFNPSSGKLPAFLSTGRRPQTPEPKPIAPLDGNDLLVWREGVTTLLGSPSMIRSIAAWRCYRPETVKAMVAASLMGCVRLNTWLRRQDPQQGDRRVAFSVEAVLEGKSETVAYHIRLKPREIGAKASWRYMPSGVGSWPFIIGNIAAAQLVIICEGQWDAMAVFDALELNSVEELASQNIAVAGVRGAANWKLLLEHHLLAGVDITHLEETVRETRVPDTLGRLRRRRGCLRPELKIMLICDADAAGDGWTARLENDEPCFAEMLQLVAGDVWVRQPLERIGKDVNDVLKAIRGGESGS